MNDYLKIIKVPMFYRSGFANWSIANYQNIRYYKSIQRFDGPITL